MLSVNTSSSWVKARGFLFAAINHSALLPTENALASEANASSTNRRAYIIFYHRTRYSCAITTLINNRITRFTRNGLLRNKMRVRCASLSDGASSELLLRTTRILEYRVFHAPPSPPRPSCRLPCWPFLKRPFPPPPSPLLLLLSARVQLAKVQCVKFDVSERKQERGCRPFSLTEYHACPYTRVREYKAWVRIRAVEAKSRFRAFPGRHAGSVRNIQIYSGIIYERLIHGVPRILLRRNNTCLRCVRSPLSNLSLSCDGFDCFAFRGSGTALDLEIILHSWGSLFREISEGRLMDLFCGPRLRIYCARGSMKMLKPACSATE